MKYKSLRISLMSILCMLFGVVHADFKDIKVTLADADKWQTTVANSATVYITVAADGTIGTTENAAEAAATLTGKWHGTAYGWSNFTADVPVNGCVKITYATHDYGNDIVVTNDKGEEVAKLNTQGAKWSADPSNVVVAYYRTNEATTLHFSKANYNPYFAVEAIDPADLPAETTKYAITFDAGKGEGTAPAAIEVNAGDKFKAPKNYTIYAEGKTLTGWDDGTKVYAIGEEITPEGNMTLTAAFTGNEVSLADRSSAVIINYTLDGYNDNPKYKFEGNTGFMVTQATVDGKTIDVKADIDATGGKFAHNGSGWHQVNAGTKVTVPSCEDAVITVGTYNDSDGSSMTFGGNAGSGEKTISYTVASKDETLEIAQKSNNYWNSLSITLPAATTPEEPAVSNDLVWDYTENNIPTTGPDNGLYYGAYVNDAAGTNMGLHGVKLNSSGWAYFEKAAVAGKLTLTFGNRKNSDAYTVSVYKGTLSADGKGVKGDLIGDIEISESPGSGSIELAADVTGIYIARKTGAEGVLRKIVFKENKPRTFKDFEIPYKTLTADGYTGADLPTGVTFSGSFHDSQHGYNNATLVVPVDGTVKFTISGCQYGGSFTVKNAAGETLTTLDQKAAGCYDAGGVLTYFYVGEPTTLTFSTIHYLSYFKAEAAEVSEVTITYKDQNGKELGTKKVFEGDALGEVPYTEKDLTIDEGFKFRGWVYTNGIKVKATDIVNGNVSVNASVTAIEEAPTAGSVQTYDLTSAIFYPEDHENFDVKGGEYYNNHGFTFNAEGSFSVAVTGKAQIALTLCEYGNGTTITVTDANGKVIKDDVPAKSASDGGLATVQYEGEATTLTFTFAAQTYLHSVTVYNVSDFMEKDASGYYIVPAGDAASLIMAINSASAEPNSKIFLPDGTYDLGEKVKTTISGTNVSLIGQSLEKTIIVTAPPVSMEGLDKADLLKNSGTGLYIQDITLQNALSYGGSDGRAASLHDQGTKTICKNVNLLSHQDTYYSHKVGGLFYFEGGELHGTVDYLCGNGKVYFNEVKLINEKRSSATITANSELYVFNNCTVENNADTYNFGRAWSDKPICVFLNTTLMDPDKLISTRWNLKGINVDYQIAGEYGTKDAKGNNITPASNVVTFAKANTELETILDASALDTYSIENVLGEWAATAQAEAKQIAAPADATYDNGTVNWKAVDGASAYALFKNGVFAGITTGNSYNITIDTTADALTIRSANTRGGFGEAAEVKAIATGIDQISNGDNTEVIYNIQGMRVKKAGKGVNIINGKKVVIK